MVELRAIRQFLYKSKSYTTGQLFLAPEADAVLLIAKHCAERVSIAPGTPVTKIAAAPIVGETKELKVSTMRKPRRK